MAVRQVNIVRFTNQIAFFGFQSQGQAIGTGVIPGGAFQFLIHGPDVTEQFVTNGGISAMGISYPYSPMSRRTV